jgi:cation:H+ antiporter
LVGLCFIALLIAYSGLTFIAARRAVAAGKDPGVTEEEDPHLPLWLALVYVPLGILGLVLGADLVIEGGVGIAMFLNVPEEYIGLTLLAIGTSLPEIGAGLVAVVKKQGEVLIGNVLGSNVFNILGAGGITLPFRTGPKMAPTFQQYDHWALGLATVVLGIVILTKARIGRLFGLLLLLIYVAYIYGLITGLNITGLFQPAGT